MYFHIQRAEDKIRCPVIITITDIMVMMMNERLLLFLLSLANEFSTFPPRASRNVSHVFLTVPYCFDTLPENWIEKGEGNRVQRLLTLNLSWLDGSRMPRGCNHCFGSPSIASKAAIDQHTECFIAAALDRLLEKLIVVGSQKIEPH
jgi:hypothetical protein